MLCLHWFCPPALSLTLDWWPWAILLFISGQGRADCLLCSYLCGTQTSSGMLAAFLSVLTVISVAVLNQTAALKDKRKVLLSCPLGDCPSIDERLPFFLLFFLNNDFFYNQMWGKDKEMKDVERPDYFISIRQTAIRDGQPTCTLMNLKLVLFPKQVINLFLVHYEDNYDLAIW